MGVTMADIAKRAGVSTVTVSRALNDKPDISKETKAHILAIARELNYAPNVHARALATGDSKTLGLIVADSANPYYAKLVRGVEDTASAHGYGVILCNTSEDQERELRAHQMLLEKRVDGMLITSIQVGSVPLYRLVREDVPFVLLNRYLEDIETDYVINDNRLGAYEATAHLCQLGHRHIAHLTGSQQISSVRERLAGYRQALEECDIPFDPTLVIRCGLFLEGAYQQAKAVVRTFSPPPTAVFAYSDLLAIGVLKALREVGLKVPQDLALVSYDDIEFAAFVEPPLTTVAQSAYEIGQQGTEILLDKIQWPEEEEWELRRVVLQPELKVRASCGSLLR